MRRFSFRLIIALLTFAIGLAAFAAWYFLRSPHFKTSDSQQVVYRVVRFPQSSKPNSDWERIYFEEINERARVARLPNLRTLVLPGGDLEVRVWNGFGVSALEGFVMKRSSGKWSAMQLDGIYSGLPRNKYQVKLQIPKSGWKECWKRLVDTGLLTLPDASQLGDEPHVTDGTSYVVEYKVDGNYRTYRYSNPEYHDRDEAKQMLEISNIIYEEFGIIEFKTKN
jgi:hypothetical protein